jgi:hypothetical protein
MSGAMNARAIEHDIKERILDLWASGMKGPEIRQQMRGGLTRQNVEYVIAQARGRGDQRAVRRCDRPGRPPAEHTRDGCPIPDTPVLSTEMGIRSVTRMVPNHAFAGQGTTPLYVPVSLPRLSFLETQP